MPFPFFNGESMKKHNIVHIHCLDHPAVFDCISKLYKHRALFDGVKIATVTRSNKEPEIYELVVSILTNLGYKVIKVGNNYLRESGHFFETSVPELLKLSKTGVVYYCHSKGVTYHPDSERGKASKLWTKVLFEHTLDKHAKIPFSSTKYKTFGSCIVKTKDFLPDEVGEQFSFVGTFFWLNVSKLTNYKARLKSKFELEGLPGLCCTLSEAYNSGPTFIPGENPYTLEQWKKKGYEYDF